MIGRSSECDVVVADPNVSRQHARVWRDGEGCWVSDLGSRVGTLVDGRRIEGPCRLGPGSEIRLGAVVGRVEIRPDRSVLSGDVDRDERNVRVLLDAVGDMQAASVDQVLRTVLDRAIALTGTERGALLLSGPDGRLEVAVARYVYGRDLDDPGFARSIPARVVAGGAAAVFTDLDADDQRGGASPSTVRANLRTVLCAPMRGSDGPVGALYVDAQRPIDAFGGPELAVFEALAVHAAAAIERARLREAELSRLRSENAALRAEPPLGESPTMRRTLDLLRRIAPSDATVLLTGETGVGKEVLARFLHRSSSRAGGPFVVVDCGAIPEGLIESELFGHARGAFTGATTEREGRFREAHGGTVFLDEIGELPLPLQTRLLRVVQEHTVQPVGGAKPVAVDVRVVGATHRDLKERVAAGTFREDLYYRLSVVTIDVPALRDRGEDALLLARRFLDRFAPGRFEGFGADARAALVAHRWPGNVRELENRVHRAALLATPPFVTAEDLGFDARVAPVAVEPRGDGPLAPLQDARAEATVRFERAYVEEALRQAKGKVGVAAGIAGVSRQMLQRLMSRHGFDRRAFQDDG